MPSARIYRISSVSGMTLLEVLISMGILTILFAMVPFTHIGAYTRYVLTSEHNTLALALEKVRNQAMSNVNQSPHGIFIQLNSYTLFQGSTYISRNTSYDEIIPSSPIISKNGLEEVIFQQLSGETSTVGSITLSNATDSIVISINAIGQINW